LKQTIEAKSDEDVVGAHQLINPLMDLVAAEGVIEAALQTGSKVSHHRKRGFLASLSRTGRAIGLELMDLAFERNQLAVEPVEGAKAEVAVAQQIGHGGLALIDAGQQGAHQRALIDLATTLTGLPASKLLADLDGTVTLCMGFH